MSYKHLFFDLDHTLWDFEKNSKETLAELFKEFELTESGSDFDTFYQEYITINKLLWVDYRQGKIDKAFLRDHRFYFTLQKIGMENKKLAYELSENYLEISPKKGYLFAGAREVLDYLSKKYTLHIITNGFKEAQLVKIESCNLTQYFDQVFISEVIGYNKPDKRIFDYALEKANAHTNTTLMIGDDMESDILGAKNAGIGQVLFNPHNNKHNENVTHEIKELLELKNFL